MDLGINLGYWGMGNDADNLELAREADRIGYSVVWAAEAYGSDAATVLAWIAAQTEQIDIGSAVFQIPGRTPANTAMTAATLDTLSGGRFRLGLVVAGPQVAEGWHGVRVGKPLARTREDITIMRKALAGADWIDVPALAASAAHLADADQALDWAARREWAERAERAPMGLTYRPQAPRAVALRVLTRIVTELDGEAPRGAAVARLFEMLAARQPMSIGGLVARAMPDGWHFARAPRRRT